jgi:hypothetical protein
MILARKLHSTIVWRKTIMKSPTCCWITEEIPLLEIREVSLPYIMLPGLVSNKSSSYYSHMGLILTSEMPTDSMLLIGPR